MKIRTNPEEDEVPYIRNTKDKTDIKAALYQKLYKTEIPFIFLCYV